MNFTASGHTFRALPCWRRRIDGPSRCPPRSAVRGCAPILPGTSPCSRRGCPPPRFRRSGTASRAGSNSKTMTAVCQACRLARMIRPMDMPRQTLESRGRRKRRSQAGQMANAAESYMDQQIPIERINLPFLRGGGSLPSMARASIALSPRGGCGNMNPGTYVNHAPTPPLE